MVSASGFSKQNNRLFLGRSRGVGDSSSGWVLWFINRAPRAAEFFVSGVMLNG